MLGLVIGNTAAPITMHQGGEDFAITNVFAVISNEISFNLTLNIIRVRAEFYKSKAAFLNGKKSFTPDEISNEHTFQCTSDELQNANASAILNLAYNKLKDKLRVIYATGTLTIVDN